MVGQPGRSFGSPLQRRVAFLHPDMRRNTRPVVLEFQVRPLATARCLTHPRQYAADSADSCFTCASTFEPGQLRCGLVVTVDYNVKAAWEWIHWCDWGAMHQLPSDRRTRNCVSQPMMTWLDRAKCTRTMKGFAELRMEDKTQVLNSIESAVKDGPPEEGAVEFQRRRRHHKPDDWADCECLRHRRNAVKLSLVHKSVQFSLPPSRILPAWSACPPSRLIARRPFSGFGALRANLG